MINWLKDVALKWVGKKLDGKKTYLAGAGFVLLAVTGCLGKVFPDQGLLEMDWETITSYFSVGLAAFGIGHKADKIIQGTQSAGQ
mgnify:CR=1 FL=1